MPARTVTVKSKSKDGLKRLVNKRIKELADKGIVYATKSYNSKRVKKTKDGYTIEISAHS